MGNELSQLITNLGSRLDPNKHTKTADALHQLRGAVAEDFPTFKVLPTGRKFSALSQRAFQNKIAYLQRKLSKLEATVEEHRKLEEGKKEDGRHVSQAWICRVFLCAPHSSGRALAEGLHLIMGSDSNIVSRASILKIKSTWAEMFKSMVLRAGRQGVGTLRNLCRSDKREFAVVILQHSQDEADLRLRSGEERDGPNVPRRGRASKVQLHVVVLKAGVREFEIPTELEPLGDKTAGTLATSLEGVARGVLEGVLPTITGGPELWVAHLMFGDAVSTNEAAAKVLWEMMRQRPFGPRIRYFLAVVKCMVHQTGLSAQSGTTGAAAALAGGTLHEEIPGIASRLYKYLFNDYFEEFSTNAEQWVHNGLKVLKDGDPVPDRTPLGRGQDVDVKQLQDLYTTHVVPDEMVELFNNGVGGGRLSHKVPSDADPDALRPELVGRFGSFMKKECMIVDEHPTITRFFTFRKCTDKMLTMDIIGMPPHVILLHKVRPREDNSKRIKVVTKFFTDPEAKQVMRRTCLNFQLTGGLEALSATNPKQGETPPVVKFSRGEGHMLVSNRLQRLFGVLSNDPLLETGPAITSLLATAMDLILRFNKLLEFPSALCGLCRRWFPATYLHSIKDFVNMDAARLDVGLGLQLRGIATNGRNETQAIGWMTSEDVQIFLEQTCQSLLTHSLAVEREAAHVKQWESSKVSHVSTASLNNICVRFSKVREAKASAIEAARTKMRKLRRSTWTSMAWKADDASRPLGQRWTATSGKTQDHDESTEARSKPSGSGQRRDSQTAQSNSSGSGQARRRFVFS